MPKRAAAIALLLCTAAAATAPIRSYDFFWHLTTGRWILEHRALPIDDPFALASAHVPWVNGEWLWDVIARAVQWSVHDRGVSLLNALFVGAIFTIAFWSAAGDTEPGVALLVSAVAFAGAADRLGIRPAEAAAMLLVVALALLASTLPISRLATAYVIVTIIWVNTHPSALLAPILAAATLLIDIRRWTVAAASMVALLINPFGWRAVTAPLALTRLVESGAFVNVEWLPSGPAIFPLLYITIVAGAIAFFTAARKREHLWRFLLFLLLAALAIRHVRNQGLYFAALPLLFTPLPRLPRKAGLIVAACAILPIGWAFAASDHTLGIDVHHFPVFAVGHLQRAALKGNIYNADRFGGYLEWVFYPERRVVTDGRNELFRDFIALDTRAHADSRAWNELLQKYSIALAVERYQEKPLELVNAATGKRRLLPASLVRYPRDAWALIAFDDAAMIFARRSAFPSQLLEPLEYRYLVPDAQQIRYSDAAARDAARTEVRRARREIGDQRVIRQLETSTAP